MFLISTKLKYSFLRSADYPILSIIYCCRVIKDIHVLQRNKTIDLAQSTTTSPINSNIQTSANLHTKMLRGGWSRPTNVSLTSNIIQQLQNMHKLEERMRFVNLLIRHGLDINTPQHEHHEYKRGYASFFQSFTFKVVSMFAVPQNLRKLEQIFSYSSFQQRKERNARIQQKFKKKYPQDWLEPANNENPGYPHHADKNQDDADVKMRNMEFVDRFLALEIDANTQRSFDAYYGRSPFQKSVPRIDQNDNRKKEKQTLLQRAIMNNNYKLVQTLLSKGADMNKKCLLTIKKALHPSEWPQSVKQFKIRQNQKQIRECQNRLKSMDQEQQLGNNQHVSYLQDYLRPIFYQENAGDLRKKLRSQKKTLFALQMFCVENEVPLQQTKFIEIGCIEIAEALNVDHRIIQLLRKYDKQGEA